MKNMKKIFALVLALMLVLGMVSAFAAESYPITITNNNATADHTYTGYQVFAGTLSTNAAGKKVLANITWGANVDGPAILTALKASSAFGTDFANATDAASVAKAMEGWTDNAAKIEAFAEIVGAHLTGSGTASTASADHKTYTINAPAAGYYIVKETGINPESGRSASGFMVNVVGPTGMTVKDNPMTPDKNILIQNGADPSQFTKVKENTANVGDTVTYC